MSVSRNKREGRYIGVINGRHQRADHLQRKLGAPFAAFDHDDCEKCGGQTLTWGDDWGDGDHHDFGYYRWWTGTSICQSCDHRQGFNDSSI